MKFSEKAKNLRSEAGLTQQQLSKFLGITASAIGYLENGQRDPTGSTLIAYAKYFDVSIDSLVGLEPDLEDTFPYPLEKKIHSENTKTTFSERLKELRSEAEKTQTEIATLIGVSRQVYANYENGINQPSIEVLNLLANIYDCSVDFLIGRSDDFGNITIPHAELPPALHADEQRLLDLFRKLNRVNRDRLTAYAEVRLEEQEGSPYYRPAK